MPTSDQLGSTVATQPSKLNAVSSWFQWRQIILKVGGGGQVNLCERSELVLVGPIAAGGPGSEVGKWSPHGATEAKYL